MDVIVLKVRSCDVVLFGMLDVLRILFHEFTLLFKCKVSNFTH